MKTAISKHILFLVSWYPSEEHPTLGNFIQKHAEIASSIASVDVLYALSSSRVQKIEVSKETINGALTCIVRYPKVKSKVPFLSSLLKKKQYLKALKYGYETLQTNYDLIHLNVAFPAGLFAQYLKKNKHIPYVITEHWTGYLKQKNVFSKLPGIIKNAHRKIFTGADQTMVVSSFLGESLKELKLVDSFKVMPNAVNQSFFFPREELKKAEETLRFIHISTFDDEHKNISGMLQAFSQLKRKYEIHLVTEGGETEVWEYIDRAKIPRSNCIVNERLNAKEIGKAMRNADCHVLFSNYETFSVVMAEAWSSGIPSIYSQCGGLTEISDSELGVQIQPKDCTDLAAQLEQFKRDDYSISTISEFGNQFSKESLTDIFHALYHE